MAMLLAQALTAFTAGMVGDEIVEWIWDGVSSPIFYGSALGYLLSNSSLTRRTFQLIPKGMVQS